MAIPLDVRYVAAPMVDQSDLPFRALVLAHGATLAYTQMLYPARLLSDPDYLAFHRRDLTLSPRPVVVQLCGNDPDTILDGARTIADLCDGIDLNLGCPQAHAQEGHYGAYLLGHKDWPLLERIVSTLARNLPIPILVKLRLCTPAPATLDLAQRLARAGASAVALHARHASARRRRQGPAQLDMIKLLADNLGVPVISNGNVRAHADVGKNLAYTGAAGAMVGEALLRNPYLFEGGVPHPVDVSLEYLALCKKYPGTASAKSMRAHVRHFVAFQCEYKPWYRAFCEALAECEDAASIESLVRGRLRDWHEAVEEAAADYPHEDFDIGEAMGTLEYKA